MTRDEVKMIFSLFTAAYNNFLPESDGERKAKLNLWELMFIGHNYTECEWAAKRCIETCIYPPTIADMNQWLGKGLTRDDKQARLPYHYEPPNYANEAYMESKFERAMRSISEAPSMAGNHEDVGDKWESKNKKG